jgi:hypothetical protein
LEKLGHEAYKVHSFKGKGNNPKENVMLNETLNEFHKTSSDKESTLQMARAQERRMRRQRRNDRSARRNLDGWSTRMF